jgi:hypothetical protein
MILGCLAFPSRRQGHENDPDGQGPRGVCPPQLRGLDRLQTIRECSSRTRQRRRLHLHSQKYLRTRLGRESKGNHLIEWSF